MILSVLIPTLPQRSGLLNVLLHELNRQIGTLPVEVILHRGAGSTGSKRNELMQQATGEYTCFIDDDDAVSHRYVENILHGLTYAPDCLSLIGEMTTNGKYPRKFIHSLAYTTYFEKDGVYYRPPNHLNVMRRDIASKFLFPDVSYAEDTAWAMQICAAGVLKTQVEVNETLYYYQYKTNK